MQSTQIIKLSESNCTIGQWKFLNSKSPVVLISGGYGAGKTQALAMKCLQLKSANPYATGLIVSQTWPSLWAITVRRLMAIICRTMPKDRWPKIKDKMGECYLDFGDGIPIFLRSASNPSTIDGLDVGWALGDELRHWSAESYQVCVARVRVKCPHPQVAFASTPAMHFMADEFNAHKKDRELIIAPTIENAKNLAPGFIDNLRLSYSKRLQRAVIDGEFTILEGSVYEAFDANPQSSKWFIDYDWRKFPNRKTYLAVDPGFRRSAWLFIHEVNPIEWVVFGQHMPENTTTQAAVTYINNLGIQFDEVWSDPAADNTQAAVGIDDLTIMRQLRGRGGRQPSIKFLSDRFRSIEYGVEKLRFLLGDPDNDQPIRVSFARNLQNDKGRNIIKDLSSYAYPEAKEGRGMRNVPHKDGVHDHGCDSLRYWSVGMVINSPLRQIFYDLATDKNIENQVNQINKRYIR